MVMIEARPLLRFETFGAQSFGRGIAHFERQITRKPCHRT
jgi:hypothetical protein